MGENPRAKKIQKEEGSTKKSATKEVPEDSNKPAFVDVKLEDLFCFKLSPHVFLSDQMKAPYHVAIAYNREDITIVAIDTEEFKMKSLMRITKNQ